MNPLPNTLLVIFGITGDLSRRYLLPALYELIAHNVLPENFHIIGISRRHVSVDELVGPLRSQEPYTAEVLEKMAAMIQMVQLNLTEPEDYTQLAKRLDTLEKKYAAPFQKLFYLSMPPHAFGPVIDMLKGAGLNDASCRIIVEKPFGYDAASGQELIDQIGASFDENQVYRIDHYLAKETAQNILTFRFNNPFFEETWNRRFIKKIVISATETIGIEGRTAFYEQTGALRDFIQSHLLQILALVAMEEPAAMDARHIHAEKLNLLKAIQPIQPDEVARKTVRAQYNGYREEVGTPHSSIETYAAIQLEIDNDRWRGVPIILQTGKALSERSTSAMLCYESRSPHQVGDNPLTIQIQPNEGFNLGIWVKRPGLDKQLELSEMDFRYRRSFSNQPPGAYERVLIDAIRGDQTLFASSAEIMRSWEIIDAITHEWSKDDTSLIPYNSGIDASDLLSHLAE
jgi:glucose-6-phosphate 1-dehydrogenase